MLHKETFAESIQPLEFEKSKPDSAGNSVDILPTIAESTRMPHSDDDVNLPSQLDKKDTVRIEGSVECSVRCTERSWRAACWKIFAICAGLCRIP